MLSSAEPFLRVTWSIALCRLAKLRQKGALPASSRATQVVSLQYHRSTKAIQPPQRAIIICCVLTLEGNRRWPLHYNRSLDWLRGQQYQHNWIIWNRKHLFLALWLWTTTGGLSLLIQLSTRIGVTTGPPFLPAGMSGSCASTQTIKVNKNSRWARAPHHKRASASCCEPPAALVWEIIRVK